ncbi:MAG: indole-3-glycerol-phosphate synthase TrpC, partial [Fimbriimonadaceae bacterium]
MSKLSEIFEFKALEVAHAKAQLPLPDLIAQAHDVSPPRGFRQALLGSPHSVALIAEVKKASPSQGLIRAEFNPV